jgi:hypothetical protein
MLVTLLTRNVALVIDVLTIYLCNVFRGPLWNILRTVCSYMDVFILLVVACVLAQSQRCDQTLCILAATYVYISTYVNAYYTVVFI